MKYIYFSLLILLGFSACKKEATVPARIYIPSVTLNAASNQGTDRHKITDLYVYVGDEFLGVFPIPTYIPVLKSGLQDYRIIAGIRVNGIVTDPRTNPFFESAIGEVDLVAGETIELPLEFKYMSTTVFSLLEDFDNANTFGLVYSGDVNHGLLSSTETVLEGTSSGLFVVDTMDNVVEIANNDLLSDLPTDGTPVFLEMDYKNTAEFHVGLIGYSNGQPSIEYKINLFPKEDWNKIYIDLSPELSGSQLNNYRIVFLIGLPKNEDGTFTATQAEVNIDNIKLIHF